MTNAEQIARKAAEKIIPPTIADDRVPERLKASLAHIERERARVQAVIAQAIADATAEQTRRVEAALTELIDEAQKIEGRYNADGDLDADEQEADTIWRCVRKIRAALNPSP